MATITFDQLIPLYRNTTFAVNGTDGQLRIADASILETVTLLHGDGKDTTDVGITIRSPSSEIAMGRVISVEILPPRSGLGSLARTLDGLLANPGNRIAEPTRYYLIAERFAYNDSTVPETVVQYRIVLRLVRALSQVAAFVDPYQAEAIFLGPGRLRVPISYKTLNMKNVNSAIVDDMESFVFDKIHTDQKAAILTSNIVELCQGANEEERFNVLLAKLPELVSKAQDGYRLFASEFSYAKIRSKTEEAISDYANKIHKTFYDIQNQVIGIPAATVIVATQLKSTKTCNVEFWANFAICVGASLFVLLLAVAVGNQLLTLRNIRGDIKRQEAKLKQDYSSVEPQFRSLYKGLRTRVRIHQFVLWGLIVGCCFGLGLTWWIFSRLTDLSVSSCF